MNSATFNSNKDAILDRLRALRVSKVVVAFSGESDEGYVDSISVSPGQDIDLRQEKVIQMQDVGCYEDGALISSSMESREMTMYAALEYLTYDWLEIEERGWEDGSGGFGNMIIDLSGHGKFNLEVSKRMIIHENNEYILD